MTFQAQRSLIVRGSVNTRPLPGWPVLLVLWGYPLWWVLGMLPFVPLIAGLVLGALMVSRRADVTLPPASLPLLAFMLWIGVCAVMIDAPSRYIGFGMRAGTLASLAVIYVYIANARTRLTNERLLLGVCAIWGLIVTGGVLGSLFPGVRLTTPVGLILPGSITSNELVRDLVFPPLAEVQSPWGAEEPFNRPSAPFPYTNGWGSGYALSMPVVLAAWMTVRRSWVRVVLPGLLVLSFVPIVSSLNRGMFLMLGIAAVYVATRLFLAANFRALAVMLTGAATAVAALLASGVVQAIAERQEVSDTTSGRASIYQATLEEVSRSPILGWGAPLPNEEIGINLGTQGSFWMYLFSYGFVGALLFLAFMVTAIIVTWPLVVDTATACLHSILVAALVGSFFYGYDFTQWLVIIVALSVLVQGADRAAAPRRSALRIRSTA